MSQNGTSVTVAQALNALADELANGTPPDAKLSDVLEQRKTDDSEPENADSQDSGTAHDCPHCDRTFPSPQALGGHIRTHDALRDAENGGDSSSTSYSERSEQAVEQARDVYPDSEAARSIAREAKLGRDAWKAIFDECAAEGCELGCYGFHTAFCESHGSRSEPEETETVTGHPNEALVG